MLREMIVLDIIKDNAVEFLKMKKFFLKFGFEIIREQIVDDEIIYFIKKKN